MKVLIQGRANLFELVGGDTVQLVNTKKALERLGIDVDLSTELNPDLSEYDLIHLSNLTRIQETYIQLKNAKKYNKPVALSTIFWPMDYFEQNGQYGIRRIINKNLGIDNIERIKAFARIVKNQESGNEATKKLITVGYSNMQQYVVNNVDLFLPNAELEMQELYKYFSICNKEYVVVPNAIDLDEVHRVLEDKDDDTYSKFNGYVVCVGRIEPRKNQLELVRSLDGTGVPLVLAGTVSRNQKKYFNEIKNIIDRNDSFVYLGELKHEEILALFKFAKVSVLPSWLDTPGLVSLEAGAMGCNLAISTKGSTKEYFKEYAYYCEPDDSQSIREAVISALESDVSTELRDMILNEYTWEKAAKATLRGYEAIL